MRREEESDDGNDEPNGGGGREGGLSPQRNFSAELPYATSRSGGSATMTTRFDKDRMCHRPRSEQGYLTGPDDES